MAYGAGVERRATRSRQVLRHVGRDLERAAGRDEVASIIALVAASVIRWLPGKHSPTIAIAARR